MSQTLSFVCTHFALEKCTLNAYVPRMTYVDQIVEKFGGVRSLARAIEKPVSTVSSWKTRGSIPDEHKVDVLNSAITAGVDLAPEDFFPRGA